MGSTSVGGRHDAGLGDLALGVAGRRQRAEARDGLVGLGQRHQEALRAARAPDEHEQQPGRERVERAGVAGLAHAEAAAHRERQVVRGLAGRLVDEDEAVHARAVPAGLELGGDLLAQEGDELVVGQLGREAGGLAVAAAAAGAGDDRHVDVAVGRAQRDLLAAGSAVDAARARAPRPSCPRPSAGGR